MSGEELFPVILPGRVAWCVVCGTRTCAPVPVRWIETTSGPGTTLYACPCHAASVPPGPVPGELEPGELGPGA
ncbi:hypothetical protein [Streptomyces sp. GSL17-111]|uniref:hypothetical protein n=1 Tax=Streptomyces sp. GSL17-111 TaxID=3121596 RepID=UPI0030F45E52